MSASQFQFGRDVERISRDELQALQFWKLKRTVSRALETPFYGKKLGQNGLENADQIQSWEDLGRIPFTSKDDLRDAYPYGLLAVPHEEVVRLHASSGTTGTPTVIYHTQADLDAWTSLTVRSLQAVGCRPGDVFQNMMTYGLFTGGIGLHYGAEQLGMLVIPASSGNTPRQFKLMQDFGTSVVHATPSYLLYLHSRMEELGIDPASLQLRKALIGAEPHSENTRRKIEDLYGIDAYNSYGLSEMNGPSVAFECTGKQGMHLWEDSYILEVINPETLEPAAPGEVGELVLTTLNRTATPILRYRTRDLTRILPGDCPCGRTSRRIDRIRGRSDDMLIINGVNVFPSQIEEVLMKLPQVGTNYHIVVEKAGALDRLIVQTEVGPDLFADDMRPLNRLRDTIKENLRALITIKPAVELHEPGKLPVSEGKAVRVTDRRKRE